MKILLTFAVLSVASLTQADDFFTSNAWDGQTLWLNANIDEPAVLELRFGD